MPKPYRVNLFVRFNNAVMRSLIRAGLRIGTFAVLTVPGRKTGRPVNVPLVVFPHGDNRYLVASYGVVNWVRNLRAADGRADLQSGHATEKISAIELPAEQAGPILRFTLQTGPPGIPRLIVRIFGVSSCSRTSTSTWTPRTTTSCELRETIRCLGCSLSCKVKNGCLVRDLTVASGLAACRDIGAVEVCRE
jgi:deazaflavin-dependent oxidoreductase (nitroreductase family)